MIKPLFILFNAVENFFSKKFFSVYLEIKKQTDAPNEEAKAIKSNASKNEKIAPIKIEKAAAKGRDKTAKSVSSKPNLPRTEPALFTLDGTGLESITQDFDAKMYTIQLVSIFSFYFSSKFFV